ncbi:type III pantothenate kinase [Mariniplasma anaerobium]|uniref:Type III pantothenate kinase n=1 Tax=Mariniplasma anaerobium TaxID=2735436 RepID=A0A7U9TJ02_9MOLU|nr:type III pantothenate kinase [Mariniplasma anaerobium]BCR36038.1 type III pantothenate kinase [Mariniplasma anaerobium]
MFLLFDVGNTNIFIGVSDGFTIIDTYRLNTEITKTADEYYIQMKNIIDFKEVKHVAISSVVPRITEKLKEISLKYVGIDPLIVGPGVKTGLNIKTDHPREVGADLICDSVGLDEDISNALIIDLGTAIKYIYVKNKTILGVIITPGVNVSIKALVGHTALLPDIDIEVPKKVLGTNTIHCMQSGVTYGVAAQVDGLIDRIRKEVNENFDVILTGGLSALIAPLCSHQLTVDSDIILKGLLKIYNKNEQFRK